MSLGDVVIGNNLQALLFGYFNDCKIIVSHQDPPKVFEKLFLPEPLFDLVGYQPSAALWSNIVMTLSLKGQIVGGLQQKHVSVSKIIKVKIKRLEKKEFEYKRCYIFDTNDITLDVDPESVGEKKYLVYDWINVRSGSKHEHDEIETKDSFLNKVYFYKSHRIDGNQEKKDAVCLSTMTAHQLQDFDYSDTMVRFKLEKLMKDWGIRGTTSGKGFAKIKLETDRREVKELESLTYKDQAKLVFMTREGPQELINEYCRSSK